MHFSDRPQARVVKKPQVKGRKTRQSKKIVRKKKKLYDFRGRVVKTIGVEGIRLESGKVVKYIGVKDPSQFMKNMGRESSIRDAYNFHDKLVRGRTVTVLLGRRTKDRNGHYLGHVFLGQDVFVNAEMIRGGHALTEESPSDFEYQSLFIRLLKDARKRRTGIWDF